MFTAIVALNAKQRYFCYELVILIPLLVMPIYRQQSEADPHNLRLNIQNFVFAMGPPRDARAPPQAFQVAKHNRALSNICAPRGGAS